MTAARWLPLTSVSTLGLLLACGTCGEAPPPLLASADPGAAVVGCRATLQVQAQGGVPPYAFQLRSGPGAVDPSTGAYTVAPIPGAAVVRVTDSAGSSQDVTLTTSLPAASSWATVDDFVTDGGTQAGLVALASDPTGTLFALGFSVTGWTVRRGTGGGTRWETVDTAPQGQFFFPGSLAAPGPGEVYAGGMRLASQDDWPCVLRRSLDDGQTWSTQVVLDPGTGHCTLTVLAPAADGGLLAAYRLEPADGGTSATWGLRASGDRGASWTTLDTFVPPPAEDGGAPAWASPVAVVPGPGGAVSVAGSGWDGHRRHWYVRSWAPGAAARTLEDDLVQSDGGLQWPSATAAAAGPGGLPLLVAGPVMDALGKSRWVLRGQGDAGWTTLDDFASPSDAGFASAIPWGLAVDQAGRPLVVGQYLPANATAEQWLVRSPARDGGGFQSADDFAYPGATRTQASVPAVTPAGEHLVGGMAWLPVAPFTRWLVRKEVPVCP